jgi:hypothetical protein
LKSSASAVDVNTSVAPKTTRNRDASDMFIVFTVA